MKSSAKWLLAAVLIGGGMGVRAQEHEHETKAPIPSVVQIIALDECDPTTFNAPPPAVAPGPDFCKNIALGAGTPLSKLFDDASKGHPDPNWDFEPDVVHMKEGVILRVSDEGGEPHTFTEVKQFGGGFLTGLNGPGEETVPECSGGFANVAVAKTRILQGSSVEIPSLSKGEHFYQCCIHPWMRVKVEVK
jgi:plastocyanin